MCEIPREGAVQKVGLKCVFNKVCGGGLRRIG